MFGNGEVWLSEVCLDDGCSDIELKIISIESTARQASALVKPRDSGVHMLLEVIFYIAIAAEAMTAALAAGRRKMDWFGVCVLACVTALGGGTFRDVMLDHYPLTWVENPWLLFVCCGAALVTIATARFMAALRWPFLLLDAIGLVVFTIIGCDVALTMGQSPVIVIVAGMITGIVGGIARDILCNDVPLVFSSELYATVFDRRRSALLSGPA